MYGPVTSKGPPFVSPMNGTPAFSGRPRTLVRSTPAPPRPLSGRRRSRRRTRRQAERQPRTQRRHARSRPATLARPPRQYPYCAEVYWVLSVASVGVANRRRTGSFRWFARHVAHPRHKRRFIVKEAPCTSSSSLPPRPLMRAARNLLIDRLLWNPSRAFPPLHPSSSLEPPRTVDTAHRRKRNGTASWPGAKLVERTRNGRRFRCRSIRGSLRLRDYAAGVTKSSRIRNAADDPASTRPPKRGAATTVRRSVLKELGGIINNRNTLLNEPSGCPNFGVHLSSWWLPRLR